NALAILAEIRSKYPQSKVVGQVNSLEKQIQSKSIGISIEKYISPSQNTPFVVNHKNTNSLHFKVLKYKELDDNLIQNFNNASDPNKQKALDAILKAYPLEKEFQLNLKAFDDYQEHS